MTEPLMAPVSATGRTLRGIPATVLVLGSIVSTQIGAAIAKDLFPAFGPRGTVFIRVASAALILLAASRPSVSRLSRRQLGHVVIFGAILGAMNFSFYEALSRIPLGICVTLEFTGPLAVAIAHSRRPRDLVWVALAAAGIVLLSPIETHDINLLGAGLALVAACCWAAYIVVGAKFSRAFEGGTGLALAMAFAAIMLVPIGAPAAVLGSIHTPALLAAGCAVGLLASAVPYSLEVEALRRMPTRVFGVWMSVEPAVAALAGFVLLGEHLNFAAIIAVVMITIASAGAAAFG